MATFHYEAMSAQGQLVSGSLEADSFDHASALLQSRGLSAHSISRAAPETPSGPDASSAPSRAHVRPVSSSGVSDGFAIEEAVLRSHMAAILERGRVIVPAL